MKNLRIITLAAVAVMFIMVGIWKNSSLTESDKDKPESNSVVKTERSSGKIFWNYYNQAAEFLNNGTYDSAAVYYEKALQLNSGHEGTLYNLGNARLFLRNFEEAETYWRRLSVLNPYSARARLQLGTLYFCLDEEKENELFDLLEAEKYFLEASSMNREETGPPLYLAKIAVMKEQPAIAEDYTDDILTSNFMSYQALFLKGYLEWEKGDHESAKEKFSEAAGLYRKTSQVVMAGEGATQAGFRPMLSEDMFCDFFGNRIQELLTAQHNASYEQYYEQFNRSVHTWKSLTESDQFVH